MKDNKPRGSAQEQLLGTRSRRTFVKNLAMALLGTGAVMPAGWAAESYPSKPIRLIVPFPAGGGGDTLARLVMTRVAKELGQTIVIENIAGAGGNVGSQAATRAPNDGYTLLYGTNGTFAINHALYKRTGFDPLHDFEPVSGLSKIAALVTVRPEMNVSTFQELLALLKSKPGKYTYASAGNGTTSHLATELLKSSAGVSMVHVPYRGGAPAITDLLGGQVDVMIDVMPNTGPQVQSGRLRALAVSTAQRLPNMPNVPTIAESGVPGFDVSAWDGIFVPKGTPAPIVAKLQAAIRKVLTDQETRQQLLERGAVAAPTTPEEMSRFVKAEIDRWGAVVKRSGATIES
ncbi:tripartite tricarboxylate transporter substrate binding protein [uncultured Azohydromonas sp.]|uniref:Bug family tripartite tricarboxylate transporter substrate binding protein n=1 Tax=uncultured Azohydromonas sp. TaxID=487342 RepID=UPI00261614FE|nr:tripartite tricarboxylate transporter substrate binding protein [uncultured Azohydromonas sp.]